ncbi:hypothetical protein [Sinorhizobium meliloti]|uniref:hypothetical protein n=1 Tax=Rhizobium meliloti TaxID=382 RepID=UPI00299CE01A
MIKFPARKPKEEFEDFEVAVKVPLDLQVGRHPSVRVIRIVIRLTDVLLLSGFTFERALQRRYLLYAQAGVRVDQC